MAKQDTALQERSQKFGALKEFLGKQELLTRLSQALPRGMRPERLVGQVLTLAMANPDLLECTHASIVLGILKSAELGLELSGPLGHAYLVPRWNGKRKCKEATFQPGWKGLAYLAYKSGRVLSLTAHVVYEHDGFSYQYGTAQRLDHFPFRDGDRGKPREYYALVRLSNGGWDFEVMSRGEVEAHRQKYSPPPQGRTDYSAWATSPDAMSLKTVVRKLCSRLPLCPEAQIVAAEDELSEMPERQQAAIGSRTSEVLGKLDESLFAESPLADGEPEAAAS